MKKLLLSWQPYADHKDSNVVNGVTLLMLGYIDTSRYKAGDTMTWILNAFITDQGENDKLCLGATIVNSHLVKWNL